MGVANKKSLAWHIAKNLEEEGANVVYSVRSNARKKSLDKLLAGKSVFICDVEKTEDIDCLKKDIEQKYKTLHGLVHSIAFANYSKGEKSFHETSRKDFLQSIDISCYSLIALADTFKNLLDKKASVVTVSISTTRMAAENYGYMAPAKAALDSTICFLAKSFSKFSEIRFNSINPGLLKTSASAGIPGYIDSFLHAEKATLRKKALTTQEAANAAIFLLSERSSGINAQGMVIDAGMSTNYFDQKLMKDQ
tara:strand:- start:96 stop:848 length:753 start_codon:yes stop_codon:yes gene_type:complete